MSIKLGVKNSEVTLERPKTFSPTLKAKGAKHELQDGSIEYDLIARKWSWRISWRWLTATQKNAIITQAQCVTLSLIDFDAAQHDVEMIEPLSIELTDSTDPIRFHISLVLEEK